MRDGAEASQDLDTKFTKSYNIHSLHPKILEEYMNIFRQIAQKVLNEFVSPIYWLAMALITWVGFRYFGWYTAKDCFAYIATFVVLAAIITYLRWGKGKAAHREGRVGCFLSIIVILGVFLAGNQYLSKLLLNGIHLLTWIVSMFIAFCLTYPINRLLDRFTQHNISQNIEK